MKWPRGEGGASNKWLAATRSGARVALDRPNALRCASRLILYTTGTHILRDHGSLLYRMAAGPFRAMRCAWNMMIVPMASLALTIVIAGSHRTVAGDQRVAADQHPHQGQRGKQRHAFRGDEIHQRFGQWRGNRIK